MATTNNPRTSASDPSKTQSGLSRIRSPVSNEGLNVISALHAKLESLEACRKRAREGAEHFWHGMADNELNGIDVLLDQLEMMVAEGRLRSRGH